MQKGMRLLRQRGVARPVLQVLEGGVPACAAETDPGRLGFGGKVRPVRIGAGAFTPEVILVWQDSLGGSTFSPVKCPRLWID